MSPEANTVVNSRTKIYFLITNSRVVSTHSLSTFKNILLILFPIGGFTPNFPSIIYRLGKRIRNRHARNAIEKIFASKFLCRIYRQPNEWHFLFSSTLITFFSVYNLNWFRWTEHAYLNEIEIFYAAGSTLESLLKRKIRQSFNWFIEKLQIFHFFQAAFVRLVIG